MFSNDTVIFVKNPPIRNIIKLAVAFKLKEQSSTASAGTTTTLTDATLSESDDYWNGARLSVRVGGVYRDRVIDDFAAGSGILTWVEPLLSAVATADAYTLNLKDTNAETAITIEQNVVDYDFSIGKIVMAGENKLVLVSYAGGFLQDDIRMETIKYGALTIAQDLLKKGKTGIAARVLGGESTTYEAELESLIPRKARLLLGKHRRKNI